MFDTPESDATREDNQLALLEELELNRGDEIRTRREHPDFRVQVEVVVRPANLSMRDTLSVEGRSVAMQRIGVTCLLRHAVLVGDLYQLTFDRDSLDVSPVVAICDRSAMLDEDAFETHFRFLSPVDLPSADDE